MLASLFLHLLVLVLHLLPLSGFAVHGPGSDFNDFITLTHLLPVLCIVVMIMLLYG